MTEPILVAKGDREVYLLPQFGNRHGLIAGATGTGKTVTLQSIAQSFSDRGVPVFMADVKGDLAGVSQAGASSGKAADRFKQLGITANFAAAPVTFWDVFGESGHPVRTTVSEMGPLLFARLLNLNDTQAGVLTITFKVADDQGLLLLDLKDLRAMLQFIGDNAAQFKTQYGNVSAASIGAIQRGLLSLEQQGAAKLFGEPALNIEDLLQTDSHGKGVINVLAADKLLQSPAVYSTFLLWLLSELFETLPEVGDPEKPRLVFLFDEAHLLFTDAPKPMLDKIEQVVRLIRSKGIGVYFVTQNPLDVPDIVLGQLGNRVQHALRAFTPRDQKAVNSAADTFRANPKFKTVDVITQLGVGEALISTLDEKGTPNPVERAFIVPPASRIGPITPEERKQVMQNSVVGGVYEKEVDRESAFEMLQARGKQAAEAVQAPPVPQTSQQPQSGGGFLGGLGGILGAPSGRGRQTVAEAAVMSAVRAASSSVGRQLVRGVLGSLLGGSTSRRRSY